MSDLRKSCVYRLYPSRSQAKRLDSVLETCRRFYNDCLQERKTAYEERGETVGKLAQLRQVKGVKATNPFAKDMHSHIRDHNAAINIRNRAGQARWALSSPLGGLAQEAAPL